MTRVDLDGVFLTFREVAKHMVARGGGGKLIAISSIGEIFGMARQVPYAASKGALGSAGALARGRARAPRHPGERRAARLDRDRRDEAAARLEGDERHHRAPHARARRWGKPEDVAGACVYLASDAARFHTGDTLRVDGGYSVF